MPHPTGGVVSLPSIERSVRRFAAPILALFGVAALSPAGIHAWDGMGGGGAVYNTHVGGLGVQGNLYVKAATRVRVGGDLALYTPDRQTSLLGSFSARYWEANANAQILLLEQRTATRYLLLGVNRTQADIRIVDREGAVQRGSDANWGVNAGLGWESHRTWGTLYAEGRYTFLRQRSEDVHLGVFGVGARFDLGR
jgi:hypothetical protein